MNQWSFLEHFRWITPPPEPTTWIGALRLIDAARARHTRDVVRLQEWLAASDAQLTELEGDPLRYPWATFRPLRLSREEDWSDWLAHLVQTSQTGVFFSGVLRGSFPRGALANPRRVRREWMLPCGYRADLGIELEDGRWIHLEVKIGDHDLKKTIGTGQAMRSGVAPAAVSDVLLLPKDDIPLWDLIVEELRNNDHAGERLSLATTMMVISWHDVARGLRTALAERDEPIGWRVLGRVFCGAIEQSLIGLPTIPRGQTLDSLSMLDVEHLIQYHDARD